MTTPAPDTEAPSVPTGLVATAVSPTQINLSWNPATDNAAVTGYGVYLNDQPLATTTATSFKHAGLAPNTTYSYRVSAYDAVPNHGNWTAIAVSVTTSASDTQAPSVPTGLVATAVSSSQVNLSWIPATDNLHVAGYYVYLNDQPLATTTGTSFEHIGLTANTTYNYRVSAFDAVPNHGDWSAAPVSVTTPSAPPRFEEGNATLTSPPNTSWVPRGTEVATFSGGAAVSSDVSGATATFTFTGTTVSWVGLRCNVCGIANVSIDGGAATPVNTAGPAAPGSSGLASEAVFTASGLVAGSHTLTITVTGSYDPTTSSGAHIAVDALDVMTEPVVLAAFSSMLDEFPNSGRGLSRMWTNVTDMPSSWLVAHRNAGYRLVTHRQLLSDYVNTDTLPQSFIYALNERANLHRAAGTKMAMQFSYDNNETDGVLRPPLARILGHIAQLKPFFTANADVIAAVHAGFLGVYGEWANWTNNWQNPTVPTAEERSAVRDALYAAVDPSTPIAFRILDDLSTWFPTPLTAAQAFTGTPQARSGIHNDCFLSNKDDSGTYWKNDGGVYERTPDRNRFRAYHAQMSEWTTMGGENCGAIQPESYPACADVLYDGRTYRWRYLRDDWGTAFHDGWKAQGCYPEIKRSFGHRFRLDTISHPQSIARGSTANVAVNLRNVGWARIFSPRKLVVTLKNRSDGTLLTGSAGDMRFLPPQATSSTTVVVPVAIPTGAAPGDYDVYVSMPDIGPGTRDNADFAVRFANREDPAKGQAWETANSRFKVGTTVTVQ